MNAKEAARKALTELKGALADLSDAQDWGARDEILRELQDFVVKDVGHVSTRHGGYVVVLDRSVKDEDGAMMLRLLLNIRGVIAVDPIVDDPKMHIAERRALYRMKDAIEAAIYDA